MTPQQIALVQQSFPQVLAIKEQAAALFYARLFETDPALRSLFRGDMRAQGVKLMAAISLVVRSLNKLDTILGDLRALAQRHVGYGVSERDYATVGAALLWTLQQGLGAGFTPDVRSAWAAAYDLISTSMIAAARSLPAPLPGAAAHVAVTRSAAQL